MTHRDASKKVWNCNDPARLEEINMGSFQRIADACELMAKNHAQLQSDRDMYERWYNDERETRKKLERHSAALRGVITKLKRRLK